MNQPTAFELWRSAHRAPYHFPMTEATWQASMYADVDSDGRSLFDRLHTKIEENGMIQYGTTAFGFDENGELSDAVHRNVIRDIAFPQGDIAYLRWIYIDGSCQHRGYGSRVMRALLAQLYAMGIRRFDTDTALDNLAAQGCYEKTGFRREGITRSYYR